MAAATGAPTAAANGLLQCSKKIASAALNRRVHLFAGAGVATLGPPRPLRPGVAAVKVSHALKFWSDCVAAGLCLLTIGPA